MKPQDYWDNEFAEGGGWERRGGREQTRAFAEHYAAHSILFPRRRFCLLDAGCGLGDALPVLAKRFPSARLYAADISRTAIQRARRDYRSQAVFEVSSLAGLRACWDVIYCSNTLEHLLDWHGQAHRLLERCQHLSILVPLEELYEGRALEADVNGIGHQHTFSLDSFDFLRQVGQARQIQAIPFRCEPEVWGLGQQVLFEICGRDCEGLHA